MRKIVNYSQADLNIMNYPCRLRNRQRSHNSKHDDFKTLIDFKIEKKYIKI